MTLELHFVIIPTIMERSGKLDVGIVGYGFAGGLHEQALRQDPRVGKISVFDIDPAVRNLAESSGIDTHSTLDGLLSSLPDVVIIATPPTEHLPDIEAISARDRRPKALVVEKPLAHNSGEALKIEQTLKGTDMLVMAGFTGHFHPEYKRAWELINAGVIGDIILFQENIHIAGGPSFPQHFLEPEFGGIIVHDGDHTVDHMFLLTGRENWDVKDARCGNNFWNKSVPDWGQATLESNGLGAQVSWAWPSKYEFGLGDYQTMIIGTKGAIKIDGFDRIRWMSNDGNRWHEELFHKPDSSFTQRHLPGFINEGKAILDAIERGKMLSNAINPSIAYGVQVHRVLDKIVNATQLQK